MDELIMELLKKYSNKGEVNLSPIMFSDIIQAACQAQANACKRVYDKEYAESSDYFGDYVLSAEITRQDYENIPN